MAERKLSRNFLCWRVSAESLGAAAAPQNYFLTRAAVAQVNLSQNGRPQAATPPTHRGSSQVQSSITLSEPTTFTRSIFLRGAREREGKRGGSAARLPSEPRPILRGGRVLALQISVRCSQRYPRQRKPARAMAAGAGQQPGRPTTLRTHRHLRRTECESREANVPDSSSGTPNCLDAARRWRRAGKRAHATQRKGENR
jgi:hypothetical protein